jgi:hypothetical protein
MEGNDYDLIQGTTPAFAWKDSENYEKKPVSGLRYEPETS